MIISEHNQIDKKYYATKKLEVLYPDFFLAYTIIQLSKTSKNIEHGKD